MARIFDPTTSDYLSYAGRPVTAFPIYLSAWIAPDAGLSGNGGILGYQQETAPWWERIWLYFFWNSGNPAVVYELKRTGTTTTLTWNPGATPSWWQSWNHVLGVSRSTTDHELYVNGRSQATSSTSISVMPSGSTRIGRGQTGSSTYNYYDGSISHCAIGNVSITTAKAESFGMFKDNADHGCCPLDYDGVQAFWRMEGHSSPEPDFVSITQAMTVNGSPTEGIGAPVPGTMRMGGALIGCA